MATDLATTEINKLIDAHINLPSAPTVAVQILNTVQNKESSLQDLEKIISADPALTGKMLRVANSAFYSLPNEVSNVSRAFAILGTNVITNIALSFVIANELRGEQQSHFNFNYFWRRSVTTAVAAKLVTELLGIRNDDIFVTALLQDIGILTMYLSLGHDYSAFLKSSKEHHETGVINSEQEKYQYDHQQLGEILLKSWRLPESITTPLRYHHEPKKAPEKHKQTAEILHIANLLASIYNGRGCSEKARLLQDKMESLFNISPDRTRDFLDEVAQNTVEMLQVFELDPGKMKPYSQMLQEANDELGRLNMSYEQLVLELKESKEKSERFANKLRKANSQLEQLAFLDGLTGLYNHRYFQENLTKELKRSKRYNRSFSLIMFDIDHFKQVNDTFGHPAGDQVLTNMAEQMGQSVRPNDILARYGGEEFVAILPETGSAGLERCAERLRLCVESLTTVVRDTSIQVTISCGGTVFNPAMSEITKQDLIDTIDRALYQSKDNGRNRVTILPAKPM